MKVYRICPHVHFRDGVEAYKETILNGMNIAESQGVYAVFDMPNTSPPIITRKDVIKRRKLVPEKFKGRYFMWIGATADRNQLREAVDVYNEFDDVIGIKFFAGKSTGNLAIIEEKKQRKVYEYLTEFGYEGVLAHHCEKETFIKDIYDSSNPISHCNARPEIAEIESGKDVLQFSYEAGFNGILHFCHVSTKGLLELISNAKQENRKITAGVTPHHLMWNFTKLLGEYGNIYKMNPPLRTDKDRFALIEGLKNSVIDWIETDHAPHSLLDKLSTNPPSGFPSLGYYKDCLEFLIKDYNFSQEQIDRITSKNIIKVFGLNL